MKPLLALLTVLLLTTGALAETRPINLSLTPNVALYDSEVSIHGLTLSIWGENPQASLALGFVNGTSGQSAGVSLGFILNYSADDYQGILLAPINYTKGDFTGWQGGLVNFIGGELTGLQIGLVNYAVKVTGLQLGLINFAEGGDGAAQLGILNLDTGNQYWFSGLPEELAPAMIFVNWRF